MKEEVKQGNVSQQKGDKKGKFSWRAVTIGGVTGVLMGIPTKAFASMFGKTSEGITPEANPIGPISMPAASIDGGQSFGEAFTEARENLGAGGVFEWRGRLYTTYTAEEWQEMSADEHDDFADKLKPHVMTGEDDNWGSVDSEDPIPNGIGEDTLPPDDDPMIEDEEEVSVQEDDQPVPEDEPTSDEDDDQLVPEDDPVAEDDDQPVAEVVDEEHEEDYSNTEDTAHEEEPAITEEEQEMLEELDGNTSTYVTSIDEVGSGMEDYMSGVDEPDPLA